MATLCAELTELLECCGQPAAAEALHSEVERVVHATAANYSSMYQDVANARRTEISYLLGYACLAAARHQLVLPHLQQLQARLIDHLRARGLATASHRSLPPLASPWITCYYHRNVIGMRRGFCHCLTIQRVMA